MTTTDLNQIQAQYGHEYRGYPLLLQPLDSEQLLIVLRATPRMKLRLSGESEHTRKQEQLGISDEAKTGDDHFDDRYFVKCDTPEQMNDVLTDDVRHKIQQLGHFVEFEMTGREYRLLTRDKDNLERVLDLLADVVDATAA